MSATMSSVRSTAFFFAQHLQHGQLSLNPIARNGPCANLVICSHLDHSLQHRSQPLRPLADKTLLHGVMQFEKASYNCLCVCA